MSTASKARKVEMNAVVEFTLAWLRYLASCLALVDTNTEPPQALAPDELWFNTTDSEGPFSTTEIKGWVAMSRNRKKTAMQYRCRDRNTGAPIYFAQLEEHNTVPETSRNVALA